MTIEQSTTKETDMKRLKFFFSLACVTCEAIAAELGTDPDLAVRLIKIHFDRERAKKMTTGEANAN